MARRKQAVPSRIIFGMTRKERQALYWKATIRTLQFLGICAFAVVCMCLMIFFMSLDPAISSSRP